MMMAERPRAATSDGPLSPAAPAHPMTPKPARHRRHSADGALATALPAACEGYARLKKRGALTWSTRFLVLRGAQLTVYYDKEDAGRGAARGRMGRAPVCAARVAGGRVAPQPELTLELALADGREWLVRVFTRADVAAWATAFHRLAAAREEAAAAAAAAGPARAASEGGRRVSFHSAVLVRTIPAITAEQAGELFYSKKEVARFSAQAASLRSRTGDAVSAAFSFRRRRHAE